MGNDLPPFEKVWEKFDNKYLAVYLAALEARRINDLQRKHLYDPNVNPILEGIKRVIAGEVKWKEKES
ncbi:hypothetical protein DRP53_06455 [candidate division WOR-3 bacterium]|uniref:DNA-directed RNA polymerase n=1 Tax=candidate division WOR-3 bacterium TaxID=2052148 RepID=A0A660SGS7_UNCW3|nr:MAG: hypothetical protein DRP53_06455 [candidate division WOR-3 bacterium]